MFSKIFKLLSKNYFEFLLFNFILLLVSIILGKLKVEAFTVIFKYIATFNLVLITYLSTTVLVTFLYCMLNKGGELRKYLTCLAILKTDKDDRIIHAIDTLNLYKITLFFIVNYFCYIIYANVLGL